jgi:leishmanolysin-like peptidase
MLTRSSIGLLLLLIASASAYPVRELSSLRAQTRWEREHVIRRVYGPDNEKVRRELHQIENRMERYSTGLNVDTNHKIQYENHPFDPETRRRRLEEEVSGNTTLVSTENLFKPMRIHFSTEALDNARDGQNDAKIDWYINEILPKTAEFWSSALKVVPISGNLIISSGELDSRTYCGDSAFTAVPSEHMSEGIENADLVLYVSGSSDSRFCPERTLAVAVPCNFDQFDRPIAGAVNVCLDNIILEDNGSASEAVAEDYTDVTIHEVGHVLGHSSNSYRFYWDPETGEPRTSRPFQSSTVLCVDGVERELIVPAENTMKFFNHSGHRYASIVTEKVRAVARNQFDCQSLEGAQLENQPTRDDSCIGDHWDERLFYPEAMTGVIAPTSNIFSSLTLALMEDSGWYMANYTQSKMSAWGLGTGCDFVQKKCINVGNDGTTSLPNYSKGFFCNKENEKSCSSELTHKLACSVVDYYYFVPQNLPGADQQYFPDSPTKGGPRQADFCPVYGSPYKSLPVEALDCRNPDNADSFNLYSEVYGADSRCLPSNMGEGLCYRTACVQDEMALRVNVRGEWLTW